MTEAQELLFNKWSRYAENIAFRWVYKNNLEFDSARYRQAALLGLWQACLHFDDSCNVPFKSFSRFRIVGAIKDEARSLDSKSRRARYFNEACPETVSIDAPHTEDQKSLHEILPDEKRDIAEKLSDSDLVQYLLSKMPRHVRKVVQLHFEEELMQIEIAEMMKVSGPRIRAILKQAMTIARQKLHIEVLKPAKHGQLKRKACRVRLSASHLRSGRYADTEPCQSPKIIPGNFGTPAAAETRLSAFHSSQSLLTAK